jgi:hypothetical protein
MTANSPPRETSGVFFAFGMVKTLPYIVGKEKILRTSNARPYIRSVIVKER